jgi:DNA-binding transcriptional ArsR family regulator
MRYTMEPEIVFKALGDSTRLRILELLKKPGRSSCDLIEPHEKGLCACDIQEDIGLSQTAIFHHMDVLKRAGLVQAEKRGRWIFYWRNETAISEIGTILSKII